jgi:ketosteroid isomerase-like protein
MTPRGGCFTIGASTMGGHMSNSDIVLELLRKTDAGDADGFAAGLAPDCEWVTPTAHVRGRDAVRDHLEGFREAFPGARHEVTASVEAGETVACEGVWIALHTGPLRMPDGELAATGKQVRLPFGAFIRVRDGAVASAGIYWNELVFMGQLGLAADVQPGRALAVVERFRDAFEAGRLDEVEQLLDPDAEVRNPFATMRGPAEFRAMAEAFTSAFSERRFEIVDAVERGNAIGVEIHVTGRHTGTFALPGAEILPTGEVVAFSEAAIIRVSDGRIASWHSYYDQLALMAQLGLVPDPAARVA